MPTLGISSWLIKQWETYLLSRTAPRRFRSPAAAQFWYEWQVKGVALPLITMLMLLCAIIWGLGAALYLQTTSLASFYNALIILGGFISFLACAAGLVLGLEVDAKPAGQRDTQLGDSVSEIRLESGMGCFLSCRPFSSREYSNAILTVAARSALVAWLMWFVLLGCCLLLMGLTRQVPESYLPQDIGILFVPLTLLGPWLAMANLAMVGLSGHGAKILFTLVAGSVGYCVLLGIINHFASNLVIELIHTVCTTIAAALVASATISAYVQARRQKYINVNVCIFAALGGCALLIAAILLRPLDTHLLYYPTAVIFIALVIAPFASMPLAIAWNRHR